jgi:tetratricopeptide (TPR) repeat protein
MSSLPFEGETVVFAGRLSSLSRSEAEGLVRQLGGGVSRRVSPRATLVVMGEGGESGSDSCQPTSPAGGTEESAGVRVLSEREFCERAGIPSTAELQSRFHALSRIRARYPQLREDRIRYLERWGLVRPAQVTPAERYYTFEALAVLAGVNQRLESGASFRAVLNDLVAERQGQLSLDLVPRTGGATVLFFPSRSGSEAAEEWFLRGSELERTPGCMEAAAEAYALALDADPQLVPALINLANIHYLQDRTELAHDLYRRAEELGGAEFFQIPFNLGNIALDSERYEEARKLYERALELEIDYADAHFYLALCLEKLGRSASARRHWQAYCRLQPEGEWVRLAREMDRVD